MDKQMLDYNIRVRLPIVILVAMVSYFTTFFASFDERNGIGYQPEQPIKYSHKLHAGDLKIDCRYCHIGSDKSRHAMVPSADICMNCHISILTERPEIKKLTSYYSKNIPIPWKRIHKTPDFVYFNHSVHVNKGLDCVECHGDLRKMVVVKQEKLITMGSCLDCHRTISEDVNVAGAHKKHGGPQHCMACHR